MTKKMKEERAAIKARNEKKFLEKYGEFSFEKVFLFLNERRTVSEKNLEKFLEKTK